MSDNSCDSIKKLNKSINDRKLDFTKYLFPNSKINQKKWLGMKEKVIINQNMKPMTFGDWNRMKNTENTINFSSDKIIEKEMSGEDFWNAIKKEITKTPTKTDGDKYVRNVNPNFFVTFYDKYRELKIKDVKPFELDAYLNDKDEIYGVKFRNSEEIIKNRILRSEILNSIENHLMYILRPHVLEGLGEDLFADIFFRNYYIQYPVKTSKYNKAKTRYNDWVYVIKHPLTGKQVVVRSENDEAESHNPIDDTIKDQEILAATGETINHIDLKEVLNVRQQFEYFRNFHFMKFLRALFQVGYRQEAILIHMIEFDHFDIEYAKIQLQIEFNTIELTVVDIPKLSWFENDQIEPDDLIDWVWEKTKPNMLFKNWDQISKGQKFRWIAKSNKDKLYLTPKGLVLILYAIPDDNWKNKDKFIEFERTFKTAYFSTIEKMLNFKEPAPKYEYNLVEELQEILQLASDLKLQDKYFEELKPKMERIGLEFDKYFHPIIPFIKNTESKIMVNYSNLENIIMDKYKKKIDPKFDLVKIQINPKDKNSFYYIIPKSELITKKEMEEYLSMTDAEFKSCFNDGFIDD